MRGLILDIAFWMLIVLALCGAIWPDETMRFVLDSAEAAQRLARSAAA